ncbi:MAG TPA: hypothetical protein VN612_06615 [Acidobacteriaceae bacterium]|nr:hypothetical protein [Acidobacteriaceae bacterium]
MKRLNMAMREAWRVKILFFTTDGAIEIFLLRGLEMGREIRATIKPAYQTRIQFF